uniref:O-antigen ligase family protein n=1 Tax=Cloacibacillus evryensis TaxID=508460 RepID=UPI00241E810E
MHTTTTDSHHFTSPLSTCICIIFILALSFPALNIKVGISLKPYMIFWILVPIILFFKNKLEVLPVLLCEKFLVIFMFIYIATILTAQNKQVSLYYALVLFYMGVFYLSLRTLLCYIDVQTIKKSIFVSGMMFSIISISMYFIGLSQLSGPPYTPSGTHVFGVLIDRGIPRLSPFKGDPNMTAFPASIFFYYYLFNDRKMNKWDNLMNKLAMFFSIAAILLTFSKGTYIANLLTYFIAQAVIQKNKLRLVINYFNLAITLLLMSFLINEFFHINIAQIMASRFFIHTEDMGSVMSNRNVLWETAIKLFFQFPIFGIGLFNFREYSNHYAHNTYLEILCESGVIGFFFYMAFILATVYSSYNLIRKNK